MALQSNFILYCFIRITLGNVNEFLRVVGVLTIISEYQHMDQQLIYK